MDITYTEILVISIHISSRIAVLWLDVYDNYISVDDNCFIISIQRLEVNNWRPANNQ